VKRRSDDGFTLVELLVVITVSAFIMAALVSAMIASVRFLVGMDENNSAAVGQQDSAVVSAQLDATTTFPALIRDLTGDLSNSKAADVTLANSMPCGAPPSSVALASRTVLLTTKVTDQASPPVTRFAVYEFSRDVKQQRAQISRYTCDTSGAGTTAAVIASGLSSTQLPTAEGPTNGVVRLTLYSVLGRKYAVDGFTRVPGPTPPPPVTGQALTDSKLYDTDVDGYLDEVLATFGTATPDAACKSASAWSVLPVGGFSVIGVSWAGSTARLSISDPSVPDTTNARVSVTYLPPTGCTALKTVEGSTPTDMAPPVLLEVSNGTGPSDGNGTIESGDSIVLRFSETIDGTKLPAGGAAKVRVSDELSITDVTGLLPVVTAAPVLHGGDYFPRPTGLEFIEVPATVSQPATSLNTVVVTLGGPCLQPSCLTLTPSPSGALDPVVPHAEIRGLDGLSAVAKSASPVPTGTFRLF